jgi:hypothetical protein
MQNAGCEVKRGKYLAFKLTGAARFIRVKSLGGDYTEEALRERCSGKRITAPKVKADGGAEQKSAGYNENLNSSNEPSLLIDIQAKIRAGAGAGYQNWMAVFNLQQSARTLMFIQENGIDSYDDLKERSAAASSNFSAVSGRLKAIEARQKEIAELQKQIGIYVKTRDIYAKYKASGFDKGFFEAERAGLTLHKAAKKYFNELGLKKLPSVNQLKQEYAALDAEKRKLYSGYKALKGKYISLGTALANAEHILFGQRQNHRNEHELSR